MRAEHGIESAVGRYIASHYTSAVEVGFGGKTYAAEVLLRAGIPVLCTDVHAYPDCTAVRSVVDDCVEPRLSLYEGADVIYAVRPGLEIVPALISLAERVHADLVVYHLGFEVYMDGGEVIDPGAETGGVLLHRYVRGGAVVSRR
ncbi:MAG: hypothetical protein MJ006_05450 [Methanocorpusculum sp.]|nr:hypothetical protein [Methanocorpusculum sp.]